MQQPKPSGILHRGTNLSVFYHHDGAGAFLLFCARGSESLESREIAKSRIIVGSDVQSIRLETAPFWGAVAQKSGLRPVRGYLRGAKRIKVFSRLLRLQISKRVNESAVVDVLFSIDDVRIVLVEVIGLFYFSRRAT